MSHVSFIVGIASGATAVVAGAITLGGAPNRPPSPPTAPIVHTAPGTVVDAPSANGAPKPSATAGDPAPGVSADDDPSLVIDDSPNAWNWLRWRRLRPGMSGAEVLGLLGEPVGDRGTRGHRWEYRRPGASSGGVPFVRFTSAETDALRDWSVPVLPVVGADTARFASNDVWSGLVIQQSTIEDVVRLVGPPSFFSSTTGRDVLLYRRSNGTTIRVTFEAPAADGVKRFVSAEG